jgi:hypothetical protein
VAVDAFAFITTETFLGKALAIHFEAVYSLTSTPLIQPL